MSGFWIKVAAAAGLVVFADRWFYVGTGPAFGVAALVWTLGVAVATPARRSVAGRCCLAIAAFFALVLVEAPGLLAWTLFWTALASAALGPMRWGGDALLWSLRLLLYAVAGLAGPARDLLRLLRVRRRRGRGDPAAIARTLALPVGGGLVFAILFAGANPIVARSLSALLPAEGWRIVPHLLLAIAVLLAVWPSLRPTRLHPRLPGIGDGRAAVALPVGTLVLSLSVFNAVFAVENLVDLAFLWTGAALPDGISVAAYARQGAYLLVCTALLAGLFVVVALHPATAGARDVRVRALVVLGVAQNVLLVASSAKRLANYIAWSGLTELRIDAMLWMALVATGLVLIGWRMAARRSAAWLVNANAVAAASVLTLASLLDIPAIAAGYNVRHASPTLPVNLCYLSELGGPALLPLIELERRATAGAVRDRVAALRQLAMEEVERDVDARSGLRERRRLARANAMLGPVRAPIRDDLRRACIGTNTRRGPLTPGIAS